MTHSTPITFVKKLLATTFMIGITLHQAHAATPTVVRFEWNPRPVQVGKDTYFYWDIRNVKECYTMTSGSGSPALRAISGIIGPSNSVVAHVGPSRWYCIDLNGQRFPSDPTKFIETTRIVEDALTAPVLTQVGGTFPAGLQVSVVFQPNLTYRYTLTGAEVTENSPQLTSPQTLNTSATFRVRAFREGFDPSPEVRASYTIIQSPVATPTISPNGGTFNGPVSVTLATSTSGAQTRFSLDGSEVTASSQLYTVPISVSSNITLNARSFKNGMANSQQSSTSFAVRAAEPTVTPNGGTHIGTINVSLSSTTAGSHMRYTIDGSPVTTSSPLYSGPFNLAATATVRAKSFKGGLTESTQKAAVFTIQAAPLVIYLHTDVLGSVIAESDSSGQLKTTTQYKPFGEVVNNQP